MPANPSSTSIAYRGHQITLRPGPGLYAWDAWEAAWTGRHCGSIYGKDPAQARRRARQQIDRALDGPDYDARAAYRRANP
jgi:hypothetical protein